MKQYTAREAGIAVLKKFEEMLLAKNEQEKQSHPKEHEDKLEEQDDSVTQDQSPEETTKKDAEGSNPEPGSEPQDANYDAHFKGHIKLAKFMGHIEAKKGSKNNG